MTTKTQPIKFYNIADDLAAYPDAWAYVIIGGRNTGKTYSTLTHYYDEEKKIIFVKRTNEDIDTLTSGNKLGQKGTEYDLDISPYADINIDRGTEVKAFKVRAGLGAFYNTVDNEAKGSPIGFLASLSRVSRIKGFGGLQICSAMVFDEFIPQPWDRVDKKEGDQLMELYKTVARAKFIKYGEELKLILLANAVNIWNPTCETLELVDIISNMCAKHQETCYLEEQKIFIRILETPPEILEKEKQSGIYKTMKNTAWGRMAFGNEFAYNDFSNIKKTALKGYRPMIKLKYKGKEFFIYQNETSFYMCTAKNKCAIVYDLNKEMGRKAFYYDYAIDLLAACIEGRMKFEKYSMYDLIVNYKKRFNI